MSGLEVIAAVAAIVGGFHASVELVRCVRQRRKQKRKKWRREDEKVETQLTKCAPPVQEEYDKGYRRLGSAFSKGDDIARFELQTQIITLQQSVISLLQKALSETAIDITSLTGTSQSVQRNVITALVQQFQRISVAQPINEIWTPEQLAVWDESWNMGYAWHAVANCDYQDGAVSFSKGQYVGVMGEGTEQSPPQQGANWSVYTPERQTGQVPSGMLTLLCLARVSAGAGATDGSDTSLMPYGVKVGDMVMLWKRTGANSWLVITAQGGLADVAVGRCLDISTGQAEVTCSLEGDGDGQLSVVKGETVWVMKFFQGYEWWEVRKENGDQGIVPSRYVKLL